MTKVDVDLIVQFERQLDPLHPERSSIPARVLGYGEMSTVLQIGEDKETDAAYKRMPMFRTAEEADAYAALFELYTGVLEKSIGINVVRGEVVVVEGRQGSMVVYLVQDRLPSSAVAHNVIRKATVAQASKLFGAILRESARLFRFNRQHRGEIELALDAQVSNWAIIDYDLDSYDWDGEIALCYFDTGTPLLRQDGVEQLSAELFLRSAPSFLTWILKLFFLDDVLNRYYDFHLVCIDILANLYKEQRPDLVPHLAAQANDFFRQEFPSAAVQPITAEQVSSYYRQDKWIWRLYLAFRRVDRSLHRLLHKNYPYILPGKTRR